MLTVYSKQNCAQCVMVKLLLESKKVQFQIKMLGVEFTAEDLAALAEKNNVQIRTFPAVFDGDNKYIGGLNEVKTMVSNVHPKD